MLETPKTKGGIELEHLSNEESEYTPSDEEESELQSKEKVKCNKRDTKGQDGRSASNISPQFQDEIFEKEDLDSILDKLKGKGDQKVNPGYLAKPLRQEREFDCVLDDSGKELYRTVALKQVMSNEAPIGFARRKYPVNDNSKNRSNNKNKSKKNRSNNNNNDNNNNQQDQSTDAFGSIPILDQTSVTGDESDEELSFQAMKLHFLMTMHPDRSQESRDFGLRVINEAIMGIDELNGHSGSSQYLTEVKYECIIICFTIIKNIYVMFFLVN